MRYLVKSRGGNFVLRDGVGRDDPVRHVGPREWVIFDNLPNNTSAEGDADVLVRPLDEELTAQGEMAKAPDAPPPAKANVAAEDVVQPKRSRGRRR
jgi:hypothetical protein